jgi:S1-C subfamily serine protease
MQGRVIGVNSQIESDSGGNDGVGFAVPSNTVKTIVAQLLDRGSVDHAYLGVGLSETQGETAGAQVTEVRSGGPADDAGLEVGGRRHRGRHDAGATERDRREVARRHGHARVPPRRSRSHPDRQTRHQAFLSPERRTR